MGDPLHAIPPALFFLPPAFALILLALALTHPLASLSARGPPACATFGIALLAALSALTGALGITNPPKTSALGQAETVAQAFLFFELGVSVLYIGGSYVDLDSSVTFGITIAALFCILCGGSLLLLLSPFLPALPTLVPLLLFLIFTASSLPLLIYALHRSNQSSPSSASPLSSTFPRSITRGEEKPTSTQLIAVRHNAYTTFPPPPTDLETNTATELALDARARTRTLLLLLLTAQGLLVGTWVIGLLFVFLRQTLTPDDDPANQLQVATNTDINDTNILLLIGKSAASVLGIMGIMAAYLLHAYSSSSPQLPSYHLENNTHMLSASSSEFPARPRSTKKRAVAQLTFTPPKLKSSLSFGAHPPSPPSAFVIPPPSGRRTTMSSGGNEADADETDGEPARSGDADRGEDLMMPLHQEAQQQQGRGTLLMLHNNRSLFPRFSGITHTTTTTTSTMNPTSSSAYSQGTQTQSHVPTSPTSPTSMTSESSRFSMDSDSQPNTWWTPPSNIHSNPNTPGGGGASVTGKVKSRLSALIPSRMSLSLGLGAEKKSANRSTSPKSPVFPSPLGMILQMQEDPSSRSPIAATPATTPPASPPRAVQHTRSSGSPSTSPSPSPQQSPPHKLTKRLSHMRTNITAKRRPLTIHVHSHSRSFSHPAGSSSGGAAAARKSPHSQFRLPKPPSTPGSNSGFSGISEDFTALRDPFAPAPMKVPSVPSRNPPSTPPTPPRGSAFPYSYVWGRLPLARPVPRPNSPHLSARSVKGVVRGIGHAFWGDSNRERGEGPARGEQEEKGLVEEAMLAERLLTRLEGAQVRDGSVRSSW